MSSITVTIPQSSTPGFNDKLKDWLGAHPIPEVVSDEDLVTTIRKFGLPWFRAGLIVYRINRQGDYEILMIHEARVQIRKLRDTALKEKLLAEGHSESEWVDGDGRWNIPAGRLQPDESFEEAAERETKEESGWEIVEVGDLLYIHYSTKPNDPFIMPVFAAKAFSGPERYQLKGEVSEISWFTIPEIYEMSDRGDLRSPKSVLGSLDVFVDAFIDD